MNTNPQNIGALERERERATLLIDSISKANVLCGGKRKAVYSFR